MSTLARNVSQVVLYENQASDFVALLWMQTPLGHWTNTQQSNVISLKYYIGQQSHYPPANHHAIHL